MSYSLEKVQSPQDWQEMHDLRRTALFIRHSEVIYDENHPDDRVPDHYPFLLKYRGKTIGTARLDYKSNVTAIIRLVAINKDYQGNGHGRALDKMLADFANDLGIKTLYVNAAPEAVNYYDKVGWQRFEWDTNELQGIAGDCVQMKKELD